MDNFDHSDYIDQDEDDHSVNMYQPSTNNKINFRGTRGRGKYRKGQKQHKIPEIEENEVRVMTTGKIKKYVDYGIKLLQGPTKEELENMQSKMQELEKQKQNGNGVHSQRKMITKKYNDIILRGTGRAINIAVVAAELIKRKVGNLHQITNLETLEIPEIWEPIESGLKPVTTYRRVGAIKIVLCRQEALKQYQSMKPGYQEPGHAIKGPSARLLARTSQNNQQNRNRYNNHTYNFDDRVRKAYGNYSNYSTNNNRPQHYNTGRNNPRYFTKTYYQNI